VLDGRPATTNKSRALTIEIRGLRSCGDDRLHLGQAGQRNRPMLSLDESDDRVARHAGVRHANDGVIGICEQEGPRLPRHKVLNWGSERDDGPASD